MSQTNNESKTIAPLQNVTLLLAAVQQVNDRAVHLPGIVVFYGPAGYGKSMAAVYATNKTRAYFVRCQSSWSTGWLLKSILREMGLPSKGTTAALAEMVQEQLAKSRRPLIIDEADHLITKRAIEVIRDIQDVSGTSIILIGEEALPYKLEKWERVHSRVLSWVPAQPANAEDARTLTQFYCSGITVEDDLLSKIAQTAGASLRRICVNLEHVKEFAKNENIKSVGLKQWKDHDFFTGQAPVRGI